MARTRYYYNAKTCNYELVKTSRWDVFWGLLGFSAGSLVVAIGIFGGYTTYFDSPQEARLKQENALLKLHYDQIKQKIDESRQVLACLQDQDNNLYRMILEAEPCTVKPAVAGKTNGSQGLIDKNRLIATTIQKVDQLKQQLYVQSKSYDELKRLARAKEKRLAAIPAIQPLSNKDLKRLSSPFGMRLHPIHKIPIMHEGVDFAAPRGTPIYATGDGVIKLAKKSFRGYGNHVEIDHGYGFLTKYCHMQDFKVKPGQKVTRGQCIGHVGNTGTSTSPHLHYEVIKNKRKINPIYYFANDLDARQYEMILELASRKIRTTS